MDRALTSEDSYQGRRILQAMHQGERYAAEIYRQIRRIPLEADALVLDFGAGDGLFCDKFARDRMPIECVEPDISLRELLKERATQVYVDIGDVRSDSYDLVYAINVLEHIEDLNKSLAGIRTALKPGGRFFVFVPAFALLWTSLDDECGHIQRFTRSSLRKALTDAGFEIEQQRYFDSLGFPAALAVRALETVGLFRYSPDTVGFYDRAIFPLSKRLDRVTSGLLGKNVLAVARRGG
jgi:SAM-dependent methyltransferase